MSDLIRMSLLRDYHASLRQVVPGVTAADLRAFDQLLAADCVVTDGGAAHPRMLEWLQAVLDRGADGADLVPAVVPVGPKPAPAGAMIGGAA